MMREKFSRDNKLSKIIGFDSGENHLSVQSSSKMV